MVERKTVERARRLRRAMTVPEVRLWSVLRMSPDGRKFRRQHPIGRYVVDFYCAAAKLAIEVDGMAHDMGGNPARDAVRDAWLEGQGIATLRISAREVLGDLDAAVRHILDRCAFPLHHAPHGPPPHSSNGED